MLTPRQKQLYDFIASEAREGRRPSQEAMRVRLGLAYLSGVSRLLAALEERGVISRYPWVPRSTSILLRTNGIRRQFIPVVWNSYLERDEVRAR